MNDRSQLGGEVAGDGGVDQLVTAVLTASRVLVGVSARSLATVEDTVTLTQFRTLVVLDNHDEINLNTLADLLSVTSSTAMRMINRLLGKTGPDISAMTSDDQVIVVAHELSPGLTVQLDREHVVGLVSEEGTRTAHAAILAHSLGIPAVMGASGALATIPSGSMLVG